MLRIGMPIEKVHADISSYDKVVICSPIWVFALASPVREFCKIYSGKIKQASYVLVHHTSGSYENAANEMDELLGLSRTSFESVRCRVGKFERAFSSQKS